MITDENIFYNRTIAISLFDNVLESVRRYEHASPSTYTARDDANNEYIYERNDGYAEYEASSYALSLGRSYLGNYKY